ncbi:MAG TPA: sporulation integral membrane protein YtvI [Ruminiclostridium sp.]|nr:sporulation integral membrane protein YtvI [Ruminiclostridium sp.]
MAENSGRKMRILINFAYFALVAAIAFLAFKYLLGWIMPFIVGFILAASVQPPVRYLHKKKGANIKACSVAGVLLLIILLMLIASYSVFKFLCWTGESAQKLPSLISSLNLTLKNISQSISPFICKMQDCTGMKFDTSLNGISQQLIKLSQLPDAAASFIHHTISSLPIFIFDFVITVIAACFIAADFSRVTQFLLRCLPKRYQSTARELKSFFLNTVVKLLRAYFKLMVITFIELLIGLLLLRVPNALILAAVIAVVDIMPVLGTGTVMIPWAIVEFLLGKTFLGAGLALVYAVITVVRNILEPRIVGNHIGLHPLVTLIAMVVGLKAVGVAGMVFFPVVIIIFKHLYESGIIKLWS